jgi:hypothetical protein
LDCQFFEDLSTWFEPIEEDWRSTIAAAKFESDNEEEQASMANPSDEDEAEQPNSEAGGESNEGMDDVEYEPEEEENEPQSPTGKGWVIQIVGHHFHNEDYHAPFEGRTYLRTTFIESLLGERGEIVTVAAGPMAGEKVLPKDIGIGFPAIIESNPIEDYWVSTAVDSVGDDGMGMGPSRRPSRGLDGGLAEDGLDLRKYRFVIQFVWKPKSPGVVELVPDDGSGNDY